MNYTVRAVRVYSVNGETKAEDYERSLSNYVEVQKEMNRLKSLGEYTSIHYVDNKKKSPN